LTCYRCSIEPKVFNLAIWCRILIGFKSEQRNG
jgi:hypothetical protein